MIIPLISTLLFSIILCPICEGYYQSQSDGVGVTCAVLHSPGSCCHYGERPLTKEQVDKIKEIVVPKGER